MSQMIFKTFPTFVCLHNDHWECAYFESFLFLLKVSPSNATDQEHSIHQRLILYAEEYIILSTDYHSNSKQERIFICKNAVLEMQVAKSYLRLTTHLQIPQTCLSLSWGQWIRFLEIWKAFSHFRLLCQLAKIIPLFHIVKMSAQFSGSRQKSIHCSPLYTMKLFKDCLTSDPFGERPLTHASQFAEDSSPRCLFNLIKGTACMPSL